MKDQKSEIKDIFETLIEDKEQKAFNTKDQKAAYMVGFLRGAIWTLKKSSIEDSERKNIIKDFIKEQIKVEKKMIDNKKESKL